MAIPTYVGVGSTGAGTGAVSCSLPAGWAEGDIFILAIEGEGEDEDPDPGPAGWTYLGTVASGTTGAADKTRLTIYWRRATDSETDPVTVPDAGDHTLAIISAWRGCRPNGNPFHKQFWNYSGSNNTSITFGAVTTDVNDCLVVCICSHGDDCSHSDQTNVNLANPAMQEAAGFDVKTTLGSDGSLMGCYGGLAVAGNTGTTSATCSASEEDAGVTLVFGQEPEEETFPTTGILDNFNRGNEGPPMTDWTDLYEGLEVDTNQCRGDAAGDDNVSYYNVATHQDSEAYWTVVIKEDGDYCFVGLRLEPDDIDGYCVLVEFNAGAANDEWYIQRFDNGSPTVLGAKPIQEVANGDKYGIRIIGDAITMWYAPAGVWNSSPEASRTDATYSAAGYLWADSVGTVIRLDDLGGGTYIPPAAGALPMAMDSYRRRRS